MLGAVSNVCNRSEHEGCSVQKEVLCGIALLLGTLQSSGSDTVLQAYTAEAAAQARPGCSAGTLGTSLTHVELYLFC